MRSGNAVTVEVKATSVPPVSRVSIKMLLWCMLFVSPNTWYTKKSIPFCILHFTVVVMMVAVNPSHDVGMSWIVGRPHHIWIQFCKCEMEVATLQHYSLWGFFTVAGQSAISIKLMDAICWLQIKCGASLKAICAAMQHALVYSKVCLIVASIHMIPVWPSTSHFNDSPIVNMFVCNTVPRPLWQRVLWGIQTPAVSIIYLASYWAWVNWWDTLSSLSRYDLFNICIKLRKLINVRFMNIYSFLQCQ